MPALRIYADTSVFGGCFDAGFAEDSRRVFEAAESGRVVLLVSDLLLRELGPAPPPVQSLLTALPADAVEMVALTADSERLRDAYLAARIVGPASRNDAAHIAIATVARADAIVSWNFRHVVRLDKIKAYNQVNVLSGYGVLTIVSPTEVRFDEPS